MNISHKDLKERLLYQIRNSLDITGNFETITYTFRTLSNKINKLQQSLRKNHYNK